MALPAKDQAALPPRLPVFVATKLADDPFGGEWRLPELGWIETYRSELAESLASLKCHLDPAPEPFIQDCMSRLALVKYTEGSAAEWGARFSEYLRLLGDFPADIWQAACDESCRQNRFFPDISELYGLMQLRLAERHRQIRRLEAVLKAEKLEEHRPSPQERKYVGAGLTRLLEALQDKVPWPECQSNGEPD